MNPKQFLALTLLATSLILNATVPQTIRITTQQHAMSISNAIASTLFKRGLDEEKAKEISQAFVNEDEELLSLMMNNIINSTSITNTELIDYLSQEALSRKKVNLSDYSSLIKMAQSIKKGQLSSVKYTQLEKISQRNVLLRTIFA